MIYPLTTNPADVNTALIRIKDSNEKDIKQMQENVEKCQKDADNISQIFSSQKTRWENYRDAYNNTLNAFYLSKGEVNMNRMKELLPWAQL